MGGVRVTHLRAAYPQATGKALLPVLEDVSLDVQPGEFVALFGPNGCGKTTFLNVLAGLIPCQSGEVLIDGKAVSETRVGYMFQDYRETLLPWQTVLQNITYPLALRGVNRKQREERAATVLGETNIALPLGAWPWQLSGGQQQLLVIARSLLCGARVMLLDEPFSALDINARLRMRGEIQEIWKRSRATIFFVTQELDEALLLADRVVLLSRRPARIMEIILSPFPRPRGPELLETQEFFDIRRHALRVFREALTTCDFTD